MFPAGDRGVGEVCKQTTGQSHAKCKDAKRVTIHYDLLFYINNQANLQCKDVRKKQSNCAHDPSQSLKVALKTTHQRNRDAQKSTQVAQNVRALLDERTRTCNEKNV